MISDRGNTSMTILLRSPHDTSSKSREREDNDIFFEEARELLCILSPQDTTDGLTMEELRVQKTNKAWKKILGYGKLELDATLFRDLLQADERERDLDLAALLEDTLTVAMRSADGACKRVSWSGTLHEGRILAVGRLCHDEADAEADDDDDDDAMDALESLNIAKVGQWRLCLQSGHLYWSPMIYTLFQIDKDKFGASYEAFLNAIHPHDRDMVNQAYLNHLQTQQPYEVIHRLLLPDQSIKWVLESCRSEFDPHGKPLRSIGTVQDITELKQTQEDLTIAKEKAEQADQLKTRFLANQSHEIRTPLNAVLGFTSLMLEDKDKLLKEHIDYLETINRSGKLLLALISDILDISKIESGLLELELKTFSLTEMLKTVDYNAQALITRKGNNRFAHAIHFMTPFNQTPANSHQSQSQFSIVPGAKDLIVADCNRLQQILNNLLSNAVKFTDKGTVEYTVQLLQESSMLLFSVRDTGIGVDQSKQHEIFHPFKQLSSSSCNLGGTGLGLSIAKKLVETMGGQLTLESSTDPHNHGSTFRFTIPYVPAPTTTPTPTPKTPDLTTTKHSTQQTTLLQGRVLVCDDNKVNCKLAERFVSRMGCQVECVEDGQLAIEKYKADPDAIDLILMDKEMPVLDGLQATRAIRAMEAARGNVKRLPIIAVTAAAAASDRNQCLEAGCDAYCSKPLNKDKLRAMLGDFLPTQR